MIRRYIVGCDAVHPDRRGGQHVARGCSTGVLVIDETTGFGVLAQFERSQHKNKVLAEALLEELLKSQL